MKEFQGELTALINKHSIEYIVGMPDFLLAAMICNIIEAIKEPLKDTLNWY